MIFADKTGGAFLTSPLAYAGTFSLGILCGAILMRAFRQGSKKRAAGVVGATFAALALPSLGAWSVTASMIFAFWAIFLSLFSVAHLAWFVSLAARDSGPGTLRVLERLHSYIADEPASFQAGGKPRGRA